MIKNVRYNAGKISVGAFRLAFYSFSDKLHEVFESIDINNISYLVALIGHSVYHEPRFAVFNINRFDHAGISAAAVVNCDHLTYQRRSIADVGLLGHILDTLKHGVLSHLSKNLRIVHRIVEVLVLHLRDKKLKVAVKAHIVVVIVAFHSVFIRVYVSAGVLAVHSVAYL